MIEKINRWLKHLGVILLPVKGPVMGDADVKDLEKAILEKLRSGELPSDFTPVPPRCGKDYDDFCKKFGQSLAEVMFLQHALITVLKKTGPVEISDKDWYESDPAGVLMMHYNPTPIGDEKDENYSLYVSVQDDQDPSIPHILRAYYSQFERATCEE